MYCPRCGTQANQTTKFCRSCGLALIPVINYVSQGGTTALQPPPPPEAPTSNNPLLKAFQELEPKQQRTLSILFFIFLVPMLGVLSGIFPPFRALIPIAAIGMPIGIVWSVMRYKAIEKRLQQQAYQNAMSAQMNSYPSTPATPTYQPPQTTPITNQLAEPPAYPTPVPPSITEEETQRLPSLPRQERQ